MFSIKHSSALRLLYSPSSRTQTLCGCCVFSFSSSRSLGRFSSFVCCFTDLDYKFSTSLNWVIVKIIIIIAKCRVHTVEIVFEMRTHYAHFTLSSSLSKLHCHERASSSVNFHFYCSHWHIYVHSDGTNVRHGVPSSAQVWFRVAFHCMWNRPLYQIKSTSALEYNDMTRADENATICFFRRQVQKWYGVLHKN